MRRFRGGQPSWYLLKTLYKYLCKPWPKQAWIPVVSWSLYFWKRVFSFRTDSNLKSDGNFISNWKFPDCVNFFAAWARQAVNPLIQIAFVYEHTKRTQEMCSPIGHNNTKHFLCPIRSRHLLEFLEMVRWQSVPRGSFARTWKLSSRLFSRGNDPFRNCLRCCWFSHDVTKIQTKKLSILPRVYFHGALEPLKTNFHSNFRFKRVLGFGWRGIYMTAKRAVM